MSSIAVDLGASSGRVLVGKYNGDVLVINEIHRFANDPVQVGNHLYWDILRLFHEIKQGMLKAYQNTYQDIESLGIDSWAVDFGLLDRKGQLLGNPYHYRDHHTDGLMEEAWKMVAKQDIFKKTGIQFLPFNTLYQLFALNKSGSSLLENAYTLLMIPDLLRYFLTGEKKSEFTNATTTQLYNPFDGKWDEKLLNAFGIHTSLFTDVIKPGTVVGTLTNTIIEELGIEPFPVIAVGEHDTASAVAAVPAIEENFAYLSCGTWSLIGTEMKQPVMSEQAFKWNFTNEGGVGNTFRLLKNIMGLWLIQECKRYWDKQGYSLSIEELSLRAQQVPEFQMLVDPDHPMFLNPTNMPEQIRAYCKKTNQVIPKNDFEIIRCITESLALKYRFVLERTEILAGKTFNGLHIVGGGTQNEILCQFTANAIGRPVWVGPVEASAIGNLIVQMIALGHIQDISEARHIVRNSFTIKTYQPQDIEQWNQAYNRFQQLMELRE